MRSNTEIMDRGMRCLLDGLGVIDAERFVSLVVSERFDYTEWQRERFDVVDEDALFGEATEYNRSHPFRPAR